MSKLKKLTSEELTELEINMFSVLVEAEQAFKDSMNKDYAANHKNDLYNESIKLQKEFERLANKADGIAEVRKSSKGAAYSLAQYYLNKYPAGSVTVSKNDVPSLFKFAMLLEGKIIEALSGRLEIERVDNCNVEMGMNGGCTKNYTREVIKTAFTRAKRDIKEEKRINLGSTKLI